MKKRGKFLSVLLVAALSLSAQEDGKEYEEAGKKNEAIKVLKHFPNGTKHESHMLPMKDGIRLAVDVFIPPGTGPYPVCLAKGYYGHFSTANYADICKNGKIVFVCVDSRGTGNSEKSSLDPKLPDYEIRDMWEIAEWISNQKWCNGNIGVRGGSGNGVAAYCSYLAKHPAIKVVAPGNSSAYTYNYWGFNNGVKRASLYKWLHFIGISKEEWPKPTQHSLRLAEWYDLLKSSSENNNTVVIAGAAWFDIVSESAIELFMHCSNKAKIFVNIEPKSHAGEIPFKFPRKNSPAGAIFPKFEDVLTNKAKIPEKSIIRYFVMGDKNDNTGVGKGNIYKESESWPPKGTTMTPFYLKIDGTISKDKSTDKTALLEYCYDPRDPAPTIGGNWMYARENMGPLDQRPLKKRKDILFFATGELKEAIEIAGKIFADIYFSTDVPDTTFVVKVVDIYPDGYEMIVRESAGMARFTAGIDKPAPVEKDKVYKLSLDLWSTAIVFEKGHKIGVYITSSSASAYELHPNSFEQVKSYENSPVARQKIHLSPEYPSCVILPLQDGIK
ncbi:MAG TPA: CocE/NonD family hydrolase [Victivallales bacterium]|nr:CocE/NonD family hydrolase [Victivallales bacterium]HRU01328.1 CocE/NonD family hydrolase [Victivallales bacterium]